MLTLPKEEEGDYSDSEIQAGKSRLAESLISSTLVKECSVFTPPFCFLRLFLSALGFNLWTLGVVSESFFLCLKNGTC